MKNDKTAYIGIFQILFSMLVILRCARILSVAAFITDNGKSLLVNPIPIEIATAPSRKTIIMAFAISTIAIHTALLVLGDLLSDAQDYHTTLCENNLYTYLFIYNIGFILLCFFTSALMFNIYITVYFDIVNIFAILPSIAISILLTKNCKGDKSL